MQTTVEFHFLDMSASLVALQTHQFSHTRNKGSPLLSAAPITHSGSRYHVNHFVNHQNHIFSLILLLLQQWHLRRLREARGGCLKQVLAMRLVHKHAEKILSPEAKLGDTSNGLSGFNRINSFDTNSIKKPQFYPMDLCKILRLISPVQLKSVAKTDRTSFAKWRQLLVSFVGILRLQMLKAPALRTSDSSLLHSGSSYCRKNSWKGECKSLNKKEMAETFNTSLSKLPCSSVVFAACWVSADNGAAPGGGTWLPLPSWTTSQLSGFHFYLHVYYPTSLFDQMLFDPKSYPHTNQYWAGTHAYRRENGWKFLPEFCRMLQGYLCLI